MKSTRLAVIFIVLFSVKIYAQQPARVTAGVDFGTGYKDKTWVPSAMYHQELSLNHFPWLRIGWGVRAWGYYAGRTDLAPKNTSLSGDTLKFGKITSNGLSFLAGASIKLWRFDIGANTDLVGIAFGARRRGLYTQTTLPDGEGAEFYNSYVPSAPSTLNALPLFLENQSGQSELFLRYWFTPRVGLKVGYVHGRITYASSEKLDNGQTRFSQSYGVPYASVSFPLYN
ncbi:hypothetical protein [Dyadobacter psychrotolerans]|uniref:Outer membrane protein beta-barrel domain-containing protein n=1 Tax=Dyadobacter psychrotolerans TaxID=2541721 RepID=A0A4R5DUK8_9BACT|nr:hypothetical protein [Dyadobacter psychrotolerans]TDE14643.1 hypothetical protein E0F88_15750 [Dyadobacter psychrotolerans]